MQLTEILAFSAFASISSFTPGPNVAIATATGVNHGVRAVVPQAIGVSFGFVLMLWAVGAGGASLLQHNAAAVLLLKFSGIAYLLYLAWKLAGTAKLSGAKGLSAFSIQQAALFQVINPKAWMMLLAATSTYAIGRADYLIRLSWMSLGFILACSLSVLFWAWLGERLRGWLAVGKRLLQFNRWMAACLAATAIWMLWQ